jgi:exosortase E/protease (VPEID-CTERM system)
MAVEGRPSGVFGRSAVARLWLMAGVLAVECVPVTVERHPWLEARTTSASLIFFFVALLFFGRGKLGAATWDAGPVRKGWLALHGCALAVFLATNYLLLHGEVSGAARERVALALWYAALASWPLTLGGALFDLRQLARLLASLGNAWGLAAIVGAVTMSARGLLLLAWDAPDSRLGQAMQAATFRGVKTVLGMFYASVQTDPANSVIGTNAFAVRIAAPCSGMEGVALMLSLTVGWLIYSRRELRMGRALLLVPVSLAMIWVLNLARIAALIAIGSAGYEGVAVVGFHSEAGWILFSAVSLGFLIAVHNVAWFRRDEVVARGGARSAAVTNVAAVYLMPMLAVLAAGALATAASSGFERLYGLRVVAVAAVLYAYRREYRQMDWSFGWLGPAAGLAVFAMWIALAGMMDKWMGAGAAASSALAAGLAQLTAGQRVAWIALRITAAVVTAPIAEELAFRGYMARRLMSADVESVPMARLSLLAVLVSSLAFGAMHGKLWVAGAAAGLVFAVVAKMRGRLGEAVAAHATANLAIAIWVLARGDYSLW